MEKFCRNCGAKLNDGAKFCGQCGTSLDGASVNTSVPGGKGTSKKAIKLVAILVAIIMAATIAFIIALKYTGSTLTGQTAVTETEADTADNAETEETDGAVKLLTQVNAYNEQGSLIREQHIYYNDANQVTHIESHLYNSDSITTFTYDNQNRLLSKITTPLIDGVEDNDPSVTSSVEYTYNDMGQLIKRRGAEGGVVEESYEYDSQGRLIRSIKTCDLYTTVAIYSYNNNGLVVSVTEEQLDTWEDTTEKSEITYIYDEYDRVVQETHINEMYTTAYKYDYTFANVILTEYQINNSTSDAYEEPYDLHGTCMFRLFLDPGNLQFYADKDGYLAKIVSSYSSEIEPAIYVFYYDDEEAVPLEEPSETIISNNEESYNEVVVHTYDEAEQLLYEYFCETYGADGLAICQVKPASANQTCFEMTISGEGGAPIYVYETYSIDLKSGEVRNRRTYKVECDLW